MNSRQIVVMGVMGVGKTTVGTALAARLGCPFYDADDLHSESNLAKLTRGVALTEDDRAPWVERVADLIAGAGSRDETIVIACSALTRRIRRRLAQASEGVVFVYLEGAPETVRARLDARHGHFADPSLLDSQYATLEVPPGAIVADARRRPDEIVEFLVAALGGV